MKDRICLIPLLLLSLGACDGADRTFMVGTLERDRVEVAVESNEPIIAIHVQDGQMLKTGDLILEQDPARLQRILAQQLALRDQSAARLAELDPRGLGVRRDALDRALGNEVVEFLLASADA